MDRIIPFGTKHGRRWPGPRALWRKLGRRKRHRGHQGQELELGLRLGCAALSHERRTQGCESWSGMPEEALCGREGRDCEAEGRSAYRMVPPLCRDGAATRGPIRRLETQMTN